jgi:Not1 N-terminal domain, CCR4-Not complex component
MYEADIEQTLANLKRKQDPPARTAAQQEKVHLLKGHIERLEQVQRALDNEAIEPEQVVDLKEAIEDFCVRLPPPTCHPSCHACSSVRADVRVRPEDREREGTF